MTDSKIEKMLIEHERLCMEDLRKAFVAEDVSRAIEPVTARILAHRKLILESFRIAPTTDFIELLDALMTANSRSADSSEDAFRADAARKVVEDYVGRLEAECAMELLHEGTGNMLPVRVKTVVEALQKENERLQQALHEAIEFDAQQVFDESPQGQEVIRARAELERLRLFETYVCGVIAMGTQADLTVDALPR